VREAACTECHENELRIAEDSHPKSKFTDPRNAELLKTLDARSCISCHVEHRPEMTNAMGVTLPQDVCFHCHSQIAQERPSHAGMDFATCASAGCHNFHDNRALYEEFLVKNGTAPDVMPAPVVMLRTSARTPARLPRAAYDAPQYAADITVIEQWAESAHARSGVNCTGCHGQWTAKPETLSCQSCHKNETEGFLDGKHGMRLSLALPAMSPSVARLPMAHGTSGRKLECTSCHTSHDFDTRRAAVDACLGCHADTHSVSYEASPHFVLWRAEISGQAAAGSGVSCATCHLPREVHRDGDLESVRVQHNQNWNLEPNEKMIRDVCMSCHSLAFSIDALADVSLVNSNFQGRPSRHIESIDMALKKAGH
jgi:hypothetical protein